MSKQNQKEAVFQAVCNVTGFNGEGVCKPSKEQRAQINMILFEGIKAGTIEMDTEKSDSDLKGYVSGLTSNWLRKDVRLNGGVKYTAKNPGSRAGSNDPELAALRKLFGTLEKEEDKIEVQGYIDARMAKISAEKQAKTVDFSALPADLAAKFQK